MPIPLFTNNAATALAVAITPTDTVLQVVAGTGQQFPSPTGGNYFMLTLIQINNPEVGEIVKCTYRNGDFLTVERGQENTQPQIFNISDNVQLRITAQSLNLFAAGGGGGGGAAATQEVSFVATQGQTVFTIPFTYLPDQNNLAVFVNGSKQVVDTNYSESSSTSITFFTGLNAGDIVEVVYGLPVASGQLNASNIYYEEPGTGSIQRTVQDKISEIPSAADFATTAEFNTYANSLTHPINFAIEPQNTVRTLTSKLQDIVSVKDFGAIGDGITDDTASITAALNSGAGTVYFGDSTCQYRITSTITPTNTALTKIYGKASILADISTLSSNTFILDFVVNSIVVEIDDLTFKPKTTNQTGTASWWNGSFTYSYKQYQAGVHLPQGSKVYNCTFLSFDYCPLYIEGTTSFLEGNTTIVENNYISQNANTSFTGYCLNNLIFTNNNVYLGGELTFPSIRNTLIEDNIVFLPGTPAIDVGGSASATTQEVKISGNIAYGRDAIVCELGISNVTIIDNDCYSMANAPNGVGIGITTNTGGQDLYRIKISDNRIYRYADESGAVNQIAVGIEVASSIAKYFSDLEITNNYIEAANIGMYITGFNSTYLIQNASISNNVIDSVGTDGLQIINTNLINVNLNKINGSGSRYGINIGFMTNGLLNGNLTQGTVTSCYNFSQTVSNVVLQSPITSATNESGLYNFTGSITGAITGRDIVSPFGAATTGYWYQGSNFINQSPASGGYIGYVCTATGNPGTWKTYGLIS
jgi:hypothetical protein